MRKIIYTFLFLLLGQFIFAQTPVDSAEAENGVLTGLTIAPQVGSSSGSYVTGFDAAGDNVTVTVNLPKAALYKIVVRYRGPYGDKVQDIYANGALVSNTSFPATTDFVNIDGGKTFLNAGANTIGVRNNWGYMDVDKFIIYTVAPNVYSIVPNLIDPKATDATKCLYEYMVSNFRKNIISGQTSDYYDQVKATAGKSPMLRAWDFAAYSNSYPYAWINGAHGLGQVPDQSPEKAIAWYNSTNKKGIVAFHWHWGSPTGGAAGTNTFYTAQTTFDVSQAVITGTQQNMDVLRDIDSIAVQLKKLSDAGVPVIWRPLHEAGGAWFWWGAKGSAACKALYNIMYDRMTNYHNLHNLIWCWSSPEADWYPGNSKVDFIGYDSYPGAFNYTEQKNMFDQLHSVVGGQKLIAMTENGPIPDIEKCFASDAPWSLFMPWNELTYSQNTTQHIVDVYANSKVLTIENPGNPCNSTPVTTYTLTTTASPLAGGTITRSPNATSYAAGAVVTLTATPAAGYTFTGWGGGATGTAATVAVTINANTTVTANFTPIVVTTYTLTTTASPLAGGTITRSPNATTSYAAGTVVTLTATPAAGYTFTGWVGGATGTAATTTVAISANVTVTANFTPVVVTTANIIGPDCSVNNSTIIFELNAAKRVNASTYNWWYTGSVASVTPVAGAPYSVAIQTGNYFSAGQVCVGTNLSAAPWYASYCKSIIKCASVSASQVVVSPTPSASDFTVLALQDVRAYTVSNYMETTVLKGGVINKGATEKFGGSLTNGVYILKVQYKNGTVDSKIIQKIN